MNLVGSLTLCVALLAVPCIYGARDPARPSSVQSPRSGESRRAEIKEPPRPDPDPKPTEPPVVIPPSPGGPAKANLSLSEDSPLLALQSSPWDSVRNIFRSHKN